MERPLLVDFTKKRTKARGCLHTCGSAYDCIPDTVEAGCEVLNPVQTAAARIDPAVLKREFEKDLVFQEAVATQRVLPFGKPEDVRNNVKRTIDAPAPGGGYILAPCRDIRAGVPPQNVTVLFEASKDFGKYPIGAAE